MRVRWTGDATVTQKPGPKPNPQQSHQPQADAQLKAARTRAEKAERALAKANAKAVSISKADHRALAKAFHPDGKANVSAARKKQLKEAFQIFNAIRFNIRD